jgi:hypothetical protein
MPSGLKRLQKAQCLHFITFSCFHRLPLIEAAGAREAVEAVLEQTRARHQGRIYAYVPMPEQVHLLVNDPIALDRLLAGESVARGSALAGGPTIMLPHPSRKGRGLDGAQSIEGEPAAKNLTGPPAVDASMTWPTSKRWQTRGPTQLRI